MIYRLWKLYESKLPFIKIKKKDNHCFSERWDAIEHLTYYYYEYDNGQYVDANE